MDDYFFSDIKRALTDKMAKDGDVLMKVSDFLAVLKNVEAKACDRIQKKIDDLERERNIKKLTPYPPMPIFKIQK